MPEPAALHGPLVSATLFGCAALACRSDRDASRGI